MRTHTCAHVRTHTHTQTHTHTHTHTQTQPNPIAAGHHRASDLFYCFDCILKHSAKLLREELAVSIYYLTIQKPMLMPEVVSGYSASPVLLDSKRRLNSQKSR